MTLYQDGADFSRDSQLVGLILALLGFNIKVAIVTAAGYPKDPTRYEQRLSGLLDGFKTSGLSHSCLSSFYVLGGECNYLFQYDPIKGGLTYLEEVVYQPPNVQKWARDTVNIQNLLNIAEKSLRVCASEMGISNDISILRKPRAIGIMSSRPSEFKLSREQLDEFALSTQRRLHQFQHIQACRNRSDAKFRDTVQASISGSVKADGIIPFCAFNGGSEVWVDIGNKLIGIQILQTFLGALGHQTLHVGDQFLSTGNDLATRSASCTIWITDPQETADVLAELVEFLNGSI